MIYIQSKHISTFILLLFLITGSLISTDVPMIPLTHRKIIPTVHQSFLFTIENLKNTFSELNIETIENAYQFLELSDKMLKLPQEYFLLVDKTHSLSPDYQSSNLKALSPYGIPTNKSGMMLDIEAHSSLMTMTARAAEEGIELLVISAYRTWYEQEALYNEYMDKYGNTARDFSAAPGHSQHQLGTAVDFKTLSNKFSDTKASNWLLENAGKYGWSLSYPQGFKEITGYRWESWHWRWIGSAAVQMQDEFFGGSQQLLLEFWHDNAQFLASNQRSNSSGTYAYNPHDATRIHMQ